MTFLMALICTPSLWSQEALFIPNEGQWEDAFSHKMPLKYGALFSKKTASKFVLKDAAQIEDLHGRDIHQAGAFSP